MAIQMMLRKENNFLYYDFPSAYWVVENAGMRIRNDGLVVYGFNLNVYPSREAKDATKDGVEVQSAQSNGIAFGGSIRSVTDGLIYQWAYVGDVNEIFPNGIPSDRDSQ